MSADERIPVQPFLDWCSRREAQIRRELNAYPAITERLNTGARARLIAELGWAGTDNGEHGMRRLHRWTHELDDGLVSRAAIEDALHHASGARELVEELYPDLPDPEPDDDEQDRYCPKCRYVVSSLHGRCPWCQSQVSPTRVYRTSRLGIGAKMTDKQIRAAHVLYTHGLTLAQVAELLYQRYGYASNESCAGTLRRAWRIRGLPQRPREEVTRATHTTHGLTAGYTTTPEYHAMLTARRRAILGTCQHIKRDGTVCGLTCREGHDVCGYHTPESLQRRREIMQRIRAQGTAAAQAARAGQRMMREAA